MSPVTVVVSVKPSPEQAAKQILATKLTLKQEGQELTAFRFALDKSGRLVRGSVNNLPRPLRTGKKT